ncbi:MAG: carbohydrate kinase family protein [Candidatus Thorarchaeota archaeon]|nr:carbohydrate kinase family protein [Candidatus Thorarchaeota archaeon]
MKMLGMTATEKNGSLWPYLLFLPVDADERDDFIRSILASKLARSVLSSFDETGRVLQRDLIENLPHSNKSILAYLKTLSSYGLITSGSTIHNGKRVVYHQLTKNGWGLSRFFFEGLPSDVEELTAFLLEDYLIRLATLFRDEQLPETTLFEIFARTRAKAILDGSKNYPNPDFLLFGASAYYTNIICEQVPSPGGLTSCSSPTRHSGGPSAELALALASTGSKVTFVSSVGNDMDGWSTITNLIQGDVDVRNIFVEDGKQTNQSIIIDEPKGSRILVGISPSTSLSITSPSQVPWKVLERAKSVYIGEIFVEVASSIAANAKANGIPVFYRCSIPFWELGLERLKPVLSQVDILLISHRAWNYLKKTLKPNPIRRIQRITDALLLIREAANKYRLVEGETQQFAECDNGTNELSEWVVAGIMQKSVDGFTIPEALEAAIKDETTRLATG